MSVEQPPPPKPNQLKNDLLSCLVAVLMGFGAMLGFAFGVVVTTLYFSTLKFEWLDGLSTWMTCSLLFGCISAVAAMIGVCWLVPKSWWGDPPQSGPKDPVPPIS